MKVNLFYNLIFIKAYNDVLRDSSSSNLHVCLFQCPYETKLPISFYKDWILVWKRQNFSLTQFKTKMSNYA